MHKQQQQQKPAALLLLFNAINLANYVRAFLIYTTACFVYLLSYPA